MRLISCNVNGRVRAALGRQLDALLDCEPDVLCLQEVTRGSYPGWCEGLLDAGYSIVSGVDLLDVPYPPPPYPSPPFPAWEEPHDQIRRKNFNLTAARHPIAGLPGLSFDDPDRASYAFPEKYVAARVRLDGAAIDVHNAHLPPGVSRGLVKIQAYEAIARRIDGDGGVPRVLCGDFNDPPAEDEDGAVLEPSANPLFEAAHSVVARVLSNPEMRDVYRDVRKPGEPFPVSHRTGWGGGKNARRYDHVLASSELATVSCDYLSEWIERTPERGRLSDHAPVEVELSIGASDRP